MTGATIGDAEGNERQAHPAYVTVEVTAAHYGMTQQHPEWSKFKSADVDGDGKIDIVDLAAIAKIIIEV
ncbi:hypothetical protein [Paenibacillus terrigena]|uniref:hypothetical protein n=1 Tax=Paenibacillus terrigena TaxID=369333 RepID=UPI0028D58997|nr:hypothetical protein [Paenibacillus terrigena]